MTNKEIQCEYCTVRSNENKCKALEIEFHNCLNILKQKKCPIYKLKQQLQEKEQECEKLKEELKINQKFVYDSSVESTKFCKKLEQYKQVLDEIMENIKAINNECFYDDFNECNNCDMRNGCSYYRKFKILNIIKKVKENK